MKITGFFVMLAVVLLIAGPGFAADEDIPCDDTVRASYAADVEAGATNDYLESKYGYCRVTPVAEAGSKSIKITNTGSIYYEEMNSCGYHPQYDSVACDVEVKQTFGFGAYPSGSLEYVLFCLECNGDNQFDYQAVGTVHVTNDISGGTPGFYYYASASTLSAPPMCTTNDGQLTRVRAILSWQRMPTDCGYIPIWGNQIDVDSRRDP